MNRFLSTCLFLLLGCAPDKAKEENAALSAKTDKTALQEAADSARTVQQDGTDTNAGQALDRKQQLPAELEIYLDRTHGLWQFPALSDQDLARVAPEEQGPYFLQGDFNLDRKQDYAIQIVENDTVFIYAFVKGKTDDDFDVYLLEKNPLVPIEGKRRSNRYLKLAKEPGTYYDRALKKREVMPQDAVSVGKEESLAVYLWEKGQFRKKEKAANPGTQGR